MSAIFASAGLDIDWLPLLHVVSNSLIVRVSPSFPFAVRVKTRVRLPPGPAFSSIARSLATVAPGVAASSSIVKDVAPNGV